jgi:hypothetical protein
MTNTDLLQLTIEGPDTTFKRSINQDQFARIALLLVKPSTSSFEEETSTNNTNQQSIRDFLNEKSPKTNPQKIVVIASFLGQKDFKSITTPLFKQYLQDAGEPIPKNITRDIKEAISLGWLAESYKHDGSYFVTAAGEKKIQTGFSAEIDIVTKRKRTGSGKRTFKPVNVRSELESIEITPDAKDMKNYWELNKGERVLWICAQLKKAGVPKLNFKEVSYFANMLGDNIDSSNITGLIEAHRKANRVATPQEDSGRQVQILKLGIDLVTLNSGEMPEGSNGAVS